MGRRMVYIAVTPTAVDTRTGWILTTSVVIPPDSEIVVKFSVSGIRPHDCTLVEPTRCLTEEYGVVVGHTLVDASSGSGSVLIVNPNVEVVVFPGCTRIGKLVPVAAISVAMEDLGLPNDGPAALPEYLEEIVGGSHPVTQLPGGPRQFNMILLRRTPGQFAAAHDGWPLPDSERNRHVCRKCCKGDKLSLVIALGPPP